MAKYQMNDEDGIGIVVSDVKNNYVIGRTGGPRVFNNFNIAKVMCRILVPKVSFLKYYIQIPELGTRKSINDCQFIDDHYEFFHNGELHQVYEKNTRKAMDLGYILLEDAEATRLTSDVGAPRLNNLQNSIVAAAESYFNNGDDTCYIKDFNVSRREICINVTNSTTKIHILHISKLMDINQDKRSHKEMCFPFRKDLDKYKSLYVMIEKDCSESIKTKSVEKAEEIVQIIIDSLKKDGMDVRYEPISTNKFYIRFEDSIEPKYSITDATSGIEQISEGVTLSTDESDTEEV